MEKLDYGKIKSNDRKGAWEKSKAVIKKCYKEKSKAIIEKQ